jgi:hypothetical protein
MSCCNRHDDGTYLQTCHMAEGHTGDHAGDDNSHWGSAEGWFDSYGDVRRPVEECSMPPVTPFAPMEEDGATSKNYS